MTSVLHFKTRLNVGSLSLRADKSRSVLFCGQAENGLNVRTVLKSVDNNGEAGASLRTERLLTIVPGL